MDDQKVQFIGNPCGHHGSYTFYKAFKFNQGNNCRILTLGEFFFVKIFSEAPVCISELQLLWEDKNNSQLLSSVRLYYLPEHTPEGKQEFHGQDEVLAVSEKIILKLEDLVSLIKDGVSWETGSVPFQDTTADSDNDKQPVNLAKSFAANNFGLKFKGHNENDVVDGGPTDSTQVTILSYPRYCRYRAVMKRLEKCEDQWLRNALVCAIGGFTVKNSNSRVVFCRDTFDDPELDNLEIRCDHLAPNLKGRPRKKRVLSKKESSQDSDSCESNGDLFVPPSGCRSKPSPLNVRTRKDSHKNGALLTDKKDITKEEEAFLQSLHKYMRSRKTPIERIPSLGFKQIDIYVFYTYAQKLGGYDQITQKRLWKHLYDQLGGNPGSTSAATCTRRHYERLLLPYERHKNGEEDELLTKSSSVNSASGKNENHEGDTKTVKTDPDSQENHKHKKIKQTGTSRGSPVSEHQSLSLTPSGGDSVRPVLTEQSVNRKPEGQNSMKIHSRNEQSSYSEHGGDVSRDDRPKAQVIRNRSKVSILSPITSQKAIHHSSSQYHAPIIHHPYQKSPSLQSPPHLHPVHSAILGFPTSQFGRPLSGTPPPGVTNKLIPKNETYSKHIAGSGLKPGDRSVNQKAHFPSHRPSVIQHTQKIKPAHQNSPGPKAAAHSIDQRLSGPHPAHQPPPPRQALPAHSNHLKRSYPPYLDPAGLGQPIHHISPYHYTPQQNSQPLHSTMKRPRLQDPSSPHYYLAQMRTLAGDYVGKVRASAASDTRLTQPKPSHQPAIPRHNPIDEQPTDLSLKKKPNSDVLDMSKTRNSTPTRDIPPHVYHLSPSESHQRPLSRTMPSSSSSPKPAVVKRVDRASSCSPLAVNRQVSPVPSRGQKTELDKLPSAHTMSPDLAMAAKTFPLSSDASHMLHPAFPHSYLSPSIVPQRILHISPQQHVHSMYEAQMRANVAQAAAYDEMVKLNMSHIQGSPSPSAHTSQGAYSHSRTASPRHTYPK